MSSQYYPLYKSPSNNIKVELDLSNYATKKDINDITHVDVSGFAANQYSETTCVFSKILKNSARSKG